MSDPEKTRGKPDPACIRADDRHADRPDEPCLQDKERKGALGGPHDLDREFVDPYDPGAYIKKRATGPEHLRAYAARLESMNQELQEFAFVASHDLREPLRKIQIFGDLLRDHCMLRYGEKDEKLHDYVERMMASAGRMADLLDGLLRYSRVSTRGKAFLPVDLKKVLDDVVSDLEVHIAQSRARIDAGKLDVIYADATQIRRLFQNLIANALKFSGDTTPEISDSGKFVPGDRSQSYEIRVADNGIGFDSQYRERIFKPFERLHGRASAHGGIGMGLAICRKIVARHGGTIRAESEPGRGSTFIVTLPAGHKNP